jgi:hypothetical protein
MVIPLAKVYHDGAAPLWTRALADWLERRKEHGMAKGQRKSNKEIRKPKKEAAKPGVIALPPRGAVEAALKKGN